MTTPPGTPPHEAGLFSAIRGWGITRGERGVFGGVVDGVAHRVGLATAAARVIVVIAAIFLNGVVLLAYAAAWAFLPDKRGAIIIQNFGRGMPNVGALIGIGLLTLMGFGGLDNGLTYHVGDFPLSHAGPWRILIILFAVSVPVVIVGGVIWLIVALSRRGRPGHDDTHAVWAAMPGQTTTTPVSPAADANAADAGVADTNAADAGVADAATDTSSATTSASPTTAPAHPSPWPRIPGPGGGFYLATFAWGLLAAAAVVMARRNGELAVYPGIAWFATFATGLGVLLIFVSLSGRKLGFLGFVGIMALIPLTGIIANADDLRDSYARHEPLSAVDLRPERPHRPHDVVEPARQFTGDYSRVVFNGSCSPGAQVHGESTSSAYISGQGLSQDELIELTSKTTYVTVTTGTSITVDTPGGTPAHVVWPDRNLSCDFPADGTTNLILSNGGPRMILVVDRDEANVIVVTEVAP